MQYRFVRVETPPAWRPKQGADDNSAGPSNMKRRKVFDTEGEEEGYIGGVGVTKESWEELVTAVWIIGARMSDLTKAISDLGVNVTEISKSNKSVSDTAKELLVEFCDLTWVQHQTKGLLHVVAKRLESLDGIERVLEKGTESEIAEKTEQQKTEKETKEKKKEQRTILVAGGAKGSEDSEEEDSEYVDEDVVKGPEISTLDVDELMEVEKEE